ncbi:hypothetical protein PHYPSEUDO_003098 [Phytophthora pseudosyringae]|uniref:Uncharacterized protein n=1 Tax=Phytophthora pseudosyringae TaxID=221518 RepID=A0A8T1WCS8_9STRA|nr:hypothetical protein PHYPSEUDO_003098 [Phytophthora pseudosyringae]
MLRLQCLVSSGGEEVRVVSIEVSPGERIGEFQERIGGELDALAKPDTVMKIYTVQHQRRLTYRQDPTTGLEVLFLDGVKVSTVDASSGAVLQSATQLVPWALVSWYFQDQQFTFPDAVDVVVVWEEDEELEM